MAYKSQPTVTRPANTTAYTAGDVVGGAIRFLEISPGGGSPIDLFVTSASLRVNVTAVPTGMTSFRLYLYDGKPPSDIADNSAFAFASGDRAAYRGYVDLGSPAVVGSHLYCQADQFNKQVRLSDALWGYLVTNGGYTPAANSEEYVPEIHGVAI